MDRKQAEALAAKLRDLANQLEAGAVKTLFWGEKVHRVRFALGDGQPLQEGGAGGTTLILSTIPDIGQHLLELANRFD